LKNDYYMVIDQFMRNPKGPVEVALLQTRHWEATTTIFGLSLGHRT